MIPKIENSKKQLLEKDIIRFESFLRAPLPAPYRQFLLAHNGGTPEPDEFPMLDSTWHTYGIIVSFLCLQDGDSYDLVFWVECFRNRVPANMLPIAVDPGGNLICLGILGERIGKVYFWDHENEAAENEPPWDENIYLIANSFDDFIQSFRNET